MGGAAVITDCGTVAHVNQGVLERRKCAENAAAGNPSESSWSVRRLIDAWALQADWQILGIGREEAMGMTSVPWLMYRPRRQPGEAHHRYLRPMESVVPHGQAVARIMPELQLSGFSPDVVLTHPGWGVVSFADSRPGHKSL